jgi:hypothetical protein
MTIHLRQICLVANDIESSVAQITAVLGIKSCYEDDAVAQWGLVNNLMPVGSDFLEVVVPTKPNTAAGRYLDRRDGDGGYMVITQADSAQTQAECKARALANKVRIAFERDQPDYHLMQLHPADMVAAFLEIDSAPANDFTGDWHPAGGLAWKQDVDQSRTIAITGVELQSSDPGALATRWGAILGQPVVNKDDEPAVELANATISFVPEKDNRGPGLSAVSVAVNDRDAILKSAREHGAYINDDCVLLCGTYFNLQAV